MLGETCCISEFKPSARLPDFCPNLRLVWGYQIATNLIWSKNLVFTLAFGIPECFLFSDNTEPVRCYEICFEQNHVFVALAR